MSSVAAAVNACDITLILSSTYLRNLSQCARIRTFVSHDTGEILNPVLFSKPIWTKLLRCSMESPVVQVIDGHVCDVLLVLCVANLLLSALVNWHASVQYTESNIYHSATPPDITCWMAFLTHCISKINCNSNNSRQISNLYRPLKS